MILNLRCVSISDIVTIVKGFFSVQEKNLSTIKLVKNKLHWSAFLVISPAAEFRFLSAVSTIIECSMAYYKIYPFTHKWPMAYCKQVLSLASGLWPTMKYGPFTCKWPMACRLLYLVESVNDYHERKGNNH